MINIDHRFESIGNASLIGEQHGGQNVIPLMRARRCAMPRLPDNPDRDISAGECGDDIKDDIAENLFVSLVAGYSQLVDDSRVRFRIGEIIARAMSRPTKLPFR
jgi:hypothetical protein